MSFKKVIVFVSDLEYIPARQFIGLLENLSDAFEVCVFQPSDMLSVATTLEAVESILDDSNPLEAVGEVSQPYEAAVMFIVPADLFQAKQLTHSFLKLAREVGIQRLGWVAPACPEESRLGKILAMAEAYVRSQEADTLVVRHAPLFSDILIQKQELKNSSTIPMPLNNRALPWIDPKVVSEGLYKWITGQVNNESPYVLMGSTYLTGKDIVRELCEVLQQNANSRKFLAKHFQSVKFDDNGLVDVEKLFPDLLELGYRYDGARTLLEETDGEKSDVLAFEELISALCKYGLCDFYDNKQELVRWLGRESISLKEWANENPNDVVGDRTPMVEEQPDLFGETETPDSVFALKSSAGAGCGGF